MRRTPECLICLVSGAGYKFKCCKRPFCSVECFSKHSDCAISTSTSHDNIQRRFNRADNFDLNLSEEEILPDELLEKVSSDPAVMSMLTDPVYHRLLLRLDNSRDRRQSFSRLFERSSVFASLVERISDVIVEQEAAR